jgi:hypothetical protein
MFVIKPDLYFKFVSTGTVAWGLTRDLLHFHSKMITLATILILE